MILIICWLADPGKAKNALSFREEGSVILDSPFKWRSQMIS